MKIIVHAVGRLKSGPEKALSDRYLERLARGAPSVGLNFGGVVETIESRLGTAEERSREESARLDALIDARTVLVLLDEHGISLSSPELAGRIAAWRDQGCRSLVVAIGGPDGHHKSVGSGGMKLSLGSMTWPHQIARILLAEQLYRVTTILSGHPYHRA